MRSKSRKKGLKITIIVVGIIILLLGVFLAVYFLGKNQSMKYYNVKLAGTNGSLTLSSYSKRLAPNLDIINRPVNVNITNDSDSAFIRAKIIFESDSEDNRVLSFVSQLNYYINQTPTHTESNYSWKYYDADNSFYLMDGETEVLRTVTNTDSNYIFVDKLTVPGLIEQIDSLNSNGDNVQVGEDVVIKIIFECVQSELQLNKSPKIENTRDFFNNLVYYEENGFTSLNGKIISYSGTESFLTLPKFVGEDYIIGVGENAFNNANIRSVVIPANYIKFDEKAFYNATNLSFVALKNQTKMVLSPNSFSANANLSIYSPSNTINFIRQNYSTYNYSVNFKPFVEVSDNNISNLQTNITYLYAPNVTEFVGDFKNFTNLKVVYAPSLRKINDNMFQGLTTIVDVDCPNALEIGKNAFNGCAGLMNVTFSKELASIGEYSFTGCSKLSNISFAKNLQIIPKEAFRGCSKLQRVELNANKLEILNGAFYNNSNLKTVNIQNLAKIEDYAFGECSSLSYFSVKTVDNLQLTDKSFSSSGNDNNLRNIFIITNQESVKNTFKSINNNFNCLVLTTNNNTITKFNGSVKNLDLTELCKIYNITKIGNSAFRNTSLVSLIIPSQINEIDNNFVDGANSLTNITFAGYNPPNFKEKSFANANENLTIYVPKATLNIYKALFKDTTLNIVGN